MLIGGGFFTAVLIGGHAKPVLSGMVPDLHGFLFSVFNRDGTIDNRISICHAIRIGS